MAAYDIAGDEVVGEDAYAEIGDEGDALDQLMAATMGARRGGRPVRTAGARIVSSRGFTQSREYPLPFDSVANVAVGAQATITTRPQTVFRGKRLVVPSDIAGSFTIDDIRVGNRSQSVVTGSNPARVFQEDAVGVSLQLDTCQISMDLSLLATNIGGAPLRFRASLIGDSVQ